MTDKTIELNRRRVLGGMITIGGAAAAAGAGTFAYFSDSQTSNNNTIIAGTLTLNGAADGQINVTNLAPGDSVGPTTIQATYDSGSTIDPAEVDFSAAISEPGGSEINPTGNTNQTATEFGNELSVTTADLTKNSAVVTDLTTSPQSVSTVSDLDGLTVDAGFGGVSPGDNVALDLAVTMPTGTGNDAQGDGVTIAVTFTAEQPSAD